jgi:hypothetical protein
MRVMMMMVVVVLVGVMMIFDGIDPALITRSNHSLTHSHSLDLRGTAGWWKGQGSAAQARCSGIGQESRGDFWRFGQRVRQRR